MFKRFFSEFVEIKELKKEQNVMVRVRKPALDEFKIPETEKSGLDESRYYNFLSCENVENFYVHCLICSKKFESKVRNKVSKISQYLLLTKSWSNSAKLSSFCIAITGFIMLIGMVLFGVEFSTLNMLAIFILAASAGLMLQVIEICIWNLLILKCYKLLAAENKLSSPLSAWYLQKLDETTLKAES